MEFQQTQQTCKPFEVQPGNNASPDLIMSKQCLNTRDPEMSKVQKVELIHEYLTTFHLVRPTEVRISKVDVPLELHVMWLKMVGATKPKQKMWKMQLHGVGLVKQFDPCPCKSAASICVCAFPMKQQMQGNNSEHCTFQNLDASMCWSIVQATNNIWIDRNKSIYIFFFPFLRSELPRAALQWFLNSLPQVL